MGRPREGIPRAGAEWEVLLAFMDWLRRSFAGKFDGVDEQAARRRTLPSATSMMGLLKHLTKVEYFWFQHCFAGRDPDYNAYEDDDDDSDFDVADEDTVADLIARYEASCDESRKAIEGATPDTLAKKPYNYPEINLRYILIHMIEETARHAGHLDILREQIDGVVGE